MNILRNTQTKGQSLKGYTGSPVSEIWKETHGISPTITLIVGGYNHARFARACLDSIAAQTCQDFELIICDDASQDNTVAVVDAWLAENKRQSVRITHSENRGLSATLNEALGLARGKYVALISLDDECLPDRLERHRSILDAAADSVAVVYSDAVVMDVDSKALVDSFYADLCHRQWPAPQGDIFVDLAIWNFIPAMSTMVRTNALRSIGGFDETLSFEDWDLYLRLAANFHFAFSEPAVSRYRVVAGSLTNANHDESIARLLMKHFGYRPDADVHLLYHIRALSEKLYQEGHPRATEVLCSRARCDPSRRAKLLSLVARIGIPGRISIQHINLVAKFLHTNIKTKSQLPNHI